MVEMLSAAFVGANLSTSRTQKKHKKTMSKACRQMMSSFFKSYIKSGTEINKNDAKKRFDVNGIWEGLERLNHEKILVLIGFTDFERLQTNK